MKFRGFDETGRWYLKIIAMLALLWMILRLGGCCDPAEDATKNPYAGAIRKMD